jgi:hypothetical protein
MTVLNQLPSKYDVKVSNNLVSSGIESENIINNKETNNNIKETNNITLPSMEEVSEFIVENNLQSQAAYDLIASDLIKGNKIKMVEKLLKSSDYILFIKKQDIKPLREIKTQEMTNIFLETLFDKIINLEKENLELFDELNKLNDLNKISFYELFCKKINLFIIKHNNDINFIILSLTLLLLLFSNQKTLKIAIFFVLIFSSIDYITNKIYSK